MQKLRNHMFTHSKKNRKLHLFFTYITQLSLVSWNCIPIALRQFRCPLPLIGRLYLNIRVHRVVDRTRCRQGAVACRCRAGRMLRVVCRGGRGGEEPGTKHPSDRYSHGGVVHRPSRWRPHTDESENGTIARVTVTQPVICQDHVVSVRAETPPAKSLLRAVHSPLHLCGLAGVKVCSGDSSHIADMRDATRITIVPETIAT